VKYYPVFLDLRGQSCLVLGTGALAAEKSAGLRAAGAVVTEVGQYHAGACAGARVVFDATGDKEVGRRVWQECERLGVLVNVVDRPELCRFIAPAVVDRDPLLVAISTSGESPFLAAAIRVRLERWLGREWGPFLELVGKIRRQLRRDRISMADQRTVYKRLLRSGIRGLLREGRADEAALAASAIMDSGGDAEEGQVALVGAGPGDPGLLTLHAQELLTEADIVFHDALIQPDVLKLCGPGTELVDVGKRSGRAGTAQTEINSGLIEAARAGRSVVRLKGGDPFVFGRGGEEMAALLGAGVSVRVVPGVTSAVAAPAAAGIPLTLRGLSSSFAVATARTVEGEAPRLEALAAATDTLIVMMPLNNLAETVERLGRVLPSDHPAALIYSGTNPDQLVVRGCLGEMVAAISAVSAGPTLLVVGRVVTALPLPPPSK
jgi:uroporphyrin-III C-methyltransferase/precorrin-2 dehydrogenase/sirohydrochlorin ferrochelatase